MVIVPSAETNQKILRALHNGKRGSLIIAFVFALVALFFYLFALPPLGSKPAELTLSDLETRTFTASTITPYRVTGEFLGDTGWEFSATGGLFGIGNGTEYYGVIAVGDRVILIRSDSRFDENTPDILTIRGVITPNTRHERNIITDVVENTPLTTDDFLPLRIFEDRDPYQFPFQMEVYMVLGFLIVALYGIGRFVWVTILRRT